MFRVAAALAETIQGSHCTLPNMSIEFPKNILFYYYIFSGRLSGIFEGWSQWPGTTAGFGIDYCVATDSIEGNESIFTAGNRSRGGNCGWRFLWYDPHKTVIVYLQGQLQFFWQKEPPKLWGSRPYPQVGGRGGIVRNWGSIYCTWMPAWVWESAYEVSLFKFGNLRRGAYTEYGGIRLPWNFTFIFAIEVVWRTVTECFGRGMGSCRYRGGFFFLSCKLDRFHPMLNKSVIK